MPNTLPPGLLLDLDDTILSYDAVSGPAWLEACTRYCDRCGVDCETLERVLRETQRWYWGDRERNRLGRLRLDETRTEIAALALEKLGLKDRQLAAELTTCFRDLRDEAIGFLPGAQEALDEFVRRDLGLALLTNGQTELQRAKLDRFGLERYFHAICVEGELGFGKPDPRVFEIALNALALEPGDVWMVGDNLEWDVFGAQQCGIFAVWNDYGGRGLPEGAEVKPDRIIRRLAELVE